MEAVRSLAIDLRGRLERLKRSTREEAAPGLDERLARLRKLQRILLRDRERIAEAVSIDFGSRSRFETIFAEILTVSRAIDEAKRNLRSWMRPRRVGVSWLYRPARAWVQPQPKGVVGIIGARNYPVNLTLAPVVGALAAGNRMMVKPSDLTPRASEVVKAILEEALDEETVYVALGGPEVGVALSKLAFDHLMFTGSATVGREVMKAASENLVPVTLELGGKSPVVVTEDRFSKVGLARTAQTVAFGKLFNAGQTCIAPDYALVPEGRVDDFVEALTESIEKMYPTLLDNPDYTAIGTSTHFARLTGLVKQAVDRKIGVVEVNPANEDLGGQAKRMAPALVIDPPDDLDIAHEEIFGPILVIKPYAALDDAIAHINAGPRPLALYVFSDDRRKIDRILSSTTSGGACINETMLQFAEESLPFGGIGESGMGAYHGRHGFETFSHMKPVFERTRFDPMSLFRPPYGAKHDRFLGWLLGDRSRQP